MKFTGLYLFDAFITMIREIVFLISFSLLVCENALIFEGCMYLLQLNGFVSSDRFLLFLFDFWWALRFFSNMIPCYLQTKTNCFLSNSHGFYFFLRLIARTFRAALNRSSQGS